MPKQFHWYTVVEQTHFGALKRDLRPGEVFQTDEVSVVKYRENSYEIPSIPALIGRQYIRPCTQEEVEKIKAGDDLSIPSVSKNTPANEILKQRLEKAGMTTLGEGQTQETASLEELRKKPQQADSPPSDWPVSDHWTKRKDRLKEIVDLGYLVRLFRFYQGQPFQKYVRSRMVELGYENPEKIAYPSQPTNMPNSENENLKRSEDVPHHSNPETSDEDVKKMLGTDASDDLAVARAVNSDNILLDERRMRLAQQDRDKAGEKAVDPSKVTPTQSGPARVEEKTEMQVDFDQRAEESLKPGFVQQDRIPGIETYEEPDLK
jgi:hypothetical protein